MASDEDEDEDLIDDTDDAEHTDGVRFDVRRVRAETLAGLYPLASKVLTDETGYRSLYLSCSQYYADEAGDAVHEGITVSKQLWPTREDASESYDRLPHELRWSLRWDSNEDAVYAFAPLCDEEGFGDEDSDDDMVTEGDGSTPSALVLVQRHPDGKLRATWLGTPHRPWLDFPAAMKDRDDGYDAVPAFVMDPPMPPLVGREESLYAEVLADPANLGVRDVLRDQWMLRNDPRGELTAITTASQPTDEQRARAAALVLEHGRGWLGPLAKVVPFSGALFGPGPFLKKAIVFFGEDRIPGDVVEAPQWATVEEVTFASTSKRVVLPAMKNLRSVGPLGTDELAPLRTGSWRIETLEVEIEDRASLELVASLSLPLRCLRLRTVDELPDLRVLARASWWSTLERVEIWLRHSEEADLEAIFETMHPQLRKGCELAVGRLCIDARSGWLVVGAPREYRLELVRLDARLDQGHQLADRFGLALPEVPVEDPDDWLCFGIGVAPPLASEVA